MALNAKQKQNTALNAGAKIGDGSERHVGTKHNSKRRNERYAVALNTETEKRRG